MKLRSLLITLIIFITTTSTIAEDLTINCLFEPNKIVYEDLPSTITTTTFLTCNLNSNLTATAVVKEAIGEPAATIVGDVEVFEVKELFILRIPKGLSTVFKNLVGIKVTQTEFSYLSADDLAEYGALKFLEISSSKLSAILSTTFSAMTNLEMINLSGNQIAFIGQEAFKTATKLKYLNLDVLCLVGETNIVNIEADIPTLTALVDTKCSTASSMDLALTVIMKNYLTAIEAPQNCGIDNPEEECPVEDCTDELEAVNLKLNKTIDELATCNNETIDLNADILKLEQKVEELEALTSNPGDGTCGYKVVSDVYSCYAKISVKTAAEQTVNWNGTHTGGNNNDAVLSMVIYSQTVEILPLNIGTAFKNLKSLAVKNSGLTKIKAGDFKTLTKLETLEISGNNLTTIDAAVFSGLTALKKVDLSANKIASLPSKIFDGLAALKILNLSDNLLKTIRYDIISSTNEISEFYLTNNALTSLDKTFIWRLQKATKIELTGTGCSYSLDKIKNPETFMAFYSNVVSNC